MSTKIVTISEFLLQLNSAGSIVIPLDLNSPHQEYPRGMLLEVFCGVVEGCTSSRTLVEVNGRSPFSDLLSSHPPDQAQ